SSDLTEGDFTILGDSIPIFSDKIHTNANLYYDEDLHILYAVIHEFADDIASELHVYSLSFPPIAGDALIGYADTGRGEKTAVFIILSGIAGLIARIVWRRTRKEE